MEKLIAYHGKPEIKDFVVADLKAHREADRIVQGQYWDDDQESGVFRGCAVGCTLETIRKFEGLDEIEHDEHGLYERYLGVPIILARLEDRIFERLPVDLAREWPVRFASAIQPGTDLSLVWPRFMLWLLTDELPNFTKRDDMKQSIETVRQLYQTWVDTGRVPSRDEASKAREVARNIWNAAAAADAATATAAADAADADATAAAYAAAADAATAAAYAAAAYAADAAAAAYAAAYAAYAAAAAAAAKQKFYQRMADKLVELLQAAPVVAAAA